MTLKHCFLIQLILFSGMMLNAQSVMRAAREPVKTVVLDHEIISSSRMENYQFRDPFRWLSPRYQKIFSFNPDNTSLSFVIQNTGTTDSYEQDLFIILQNAKVSAIIVQDGFSGQKLTVNEPEKVSVPTNSLNDGILGLLPFAPSTQVLVDSYKIGSKKWSNHIMVEVTLEEVFSQSLIFTAIVKNPDKSANIKDEILTIAFSPFTSLLRLLGESCSSRMSFVTHNIKLPDGIQFNKEENVKAEGINTAPSKVLKNDVYVDHRDGNSYKTAKIGDDIWMTENLRYLPEVSGIEINAWSTLYTKSVYVFDYNENSVSQAKATKNYRDYGALYSYEMAKTACPAGWSLPTDDQWQNLINHLALVPDIINIQFGGRADFYNQRFSSLKYLGFYWSGTQNPGILRYAYFGDSGGSMGDGTEIYAFSVRCVKK